MNRVLRPAVLLLPALAACYTYREASIESARIGEPVRARISGAEAERVAEILGRDDRYLEGELLERTDTTLLIAVPSTTGAEGGSVTRAYQRIQVPRTGVQEVELRELDRLRTTGAVVVVAAGVSAAVVGALSAIGKPNDDGKGRPNPEDFRPPIYNIRLLSIPVRIGW
jgi:hypothetical protein